VVKKVMDDSISQGDQREQPSVLDCLSFRASPRRNLSTRHRMQGVLWKRRDLFKYHWRPRWFVLHNEQHLLTYYLLANKHKKKNRNYQNLQTSSQSAQSAQATPNTEGGNRSRTASENSIVSQNTVDYDVVPRGSLYLLGSSVEANHLLSKPSEDLYVMTITDHEHATYVHLAARSVEVREEWMQQIMVACNANDVAATTTTGSGGSNETSILNNSINLQSPQRRRAPREPRTPATMPVTSTRINTTPTRRRSAAEAAAVHAIKSDFDRTLERLVLNHLPSSLTPVGLWTYEAHALPPSTYEKMEQVLNVLDWEGESSWKEKLATAKERVDVILSDRELESLEEILQQTKPKNELKPAPSPSRNIPNTQWSTLPSDSLYENTPPSVTQAMDDLLQRYLPYVDDVNHSDLQFKYDNKGVHCSVHNTQQLIRSIRLVFDHSPSDYLQMLWVFEKDSEMESNVTRQEPMHHYNPNTSLVYKAYQAVWPTGPREFCSAAHWRLLKNTKNDNLALCLLAFSCPEAEAMRPRVAPKHVRGYLNVSLHVWEQTHSGCKHTRILSYDLKGQIPKAIIQTVMTQQADLPRIMDAYLQKVKKRRDRSIASVPEMSYETLYKVLNNSQADKKKKKVKAKKKNSSASSIISSKSEDERSEVLSRVDSDSDSIFDISPTTEATLRSRSSPPDIFLEGLVLLAPVIVQHFFLDNTSVAFKILQRLLPIDPLLSSLIITLGSAFFAIRWVIMEHLLYSSIQLSSEYEISTMKGGKTQCHFTFNLRNMERYLKNKNEVKEKGSPQMKLSHVVIRALALAMEHNPQSVARRILPTLPLVYNPSIVLHDESTMAQYVDIVWIPPEQQQSLENVTDYLSDPKAQVDPNFLEANLLGPSCRLWVVPDHILQSHPMVQVDWHAPDAPLSIVISSYLKRQTLARTTNHLDVSMTFQSHDVSACRSLAKQFQQLIQMPDLCDE